MLDLHTPADQRQAYSVQWHIVAIAKAILGLQVLCFASLADAVQLSTSGFTELICAVGRQRGCQMFLYGSGLF